VRGIQIDDTTVRDCLAERRPDLRSGLVVQGGGMRGVYSMGALTALEEAGLRESFDVVAGSSSGAINAAYFLSGQAAEAVDLYTRQLSNRTFINALRPWRIVDVDFMVDVVLKQRLPLTTEVLRTSPSLLQVVVVNAETGQPEVVTNRDDDLDFYEVIRATAALPGLYNKVVRLRNGRYVDGALVDALPVARALEAGADRVLTIATRVFGYREKPAPWPYRRIARLLTRGQAPAIRSLVSQPNVLLAETLRRLEDHSAPVRGWCLWPSDPEVLVSRTTTDGPRLRQCAEMGRRDMRRLLAGHQGVQGGADRGGIQCLP
jgi:predicted patatin/cPLA2 family phospholipase